MKKMVLGLCLSTFVCASTSVVAQFQTGFSLGDPEAQLMQVQNSTGFYCEIIAANKSIVALAPGELAQDKRVLQGSMEQMPVWAICYKDKALSEYVGFTAVTFNLDMNNPTSNYWIVTNAMLRGPDGGIVDATRFPPATPQIGFKKVRFPKAPVASGSYLNIFNNSRFPALLQIEGKSEVMLLPGKLYPGWIMGGYGSYQIHIVMTATNSPTNATQTMGMWAIQIPPGPFTGNIVTTQAFWPESKDFR